MWPILDKDRFSVYRASGKLSHLEEKIKEIPFDGPIGIGHTRWATHGLPTESNAHPHKVRGVSLVQNGIIENYSELKKELIKSKVQFSSETDTEVLTHLIARQMEQGQDLVTSVQTVIPKVHGAYSILAVSESEPDSMVAVKAGPPLILGLGEKEIFLASDIQAFVEHTNRVVYLNDFEIVKVKGTQFGVFNIQGEKVPWKKKTVNVSAFNSDKKGFRHYMLKEIFEQPAAVASAIKPYINPGTKTVNHSQLGLDFSEPPPTHPGGTKDSEKTLHGGLWNQLLCRSLWKIHH